MNDTRYAARALVAVVAGAAAALGVAHAQTSGRLMIDVADCIKLDAPETRLACYEARVAEVFRERASQAEAARPAAPAASAPSAPSSAPAAARTATVPVAEAVQSRDFQQTRRDEDNARAAAEAAAKEFVSRVADAREVLPNAWQITLENGQVWRQTVSKHYELRPGQQVRVYGTRWGNASRLSAEGINGYIQVERVR